MAGHIILRLPGIEYDQREMVRKVDQDGRVSFDGKLFKIGQAFVGQHVALRPSSNDGQYSVCFAHHVIKTLDLRTSGI